MYQRDTDWGGYLALRESTNQIVTALERRTPTLLFQDFVNSIVAENRHDQQIQSLQAISANQQWAAFQLEQGFGKMVASQQVLAQVLQSGFGATTRQIGQLGGSIEKLQASFDWWMGESLWKLEAQGDTLKAILDTLQAPLDAQARELRRRAEFAYQQGWYDEALNDFLESERKNYQDFSIHQAIGNIYLYHREPPDLTAARDYFLKAARYATPRSTYHAALGYMYAGFASYMLRDDAAAVEHARRAVTLDANLAEAWYNLAKFAGVAAKSDIVASALERAIELDRNYAVKASADADFAKVEAVLRSLIQRLTAVARQRAEDLLLPVRATLDKHIIPSVQRVQMDAEMILIAKLLNEATLFSYQDAEARLKAVQDVLNSLRLDELARTRNRLIEEINRLTAEARSITTDTIWCDEFVGNLGRLADTVCVGGWDECHYAETSLLAWGKQSAEKIAKARQHAERLRELHEIYRENKQKYEVVAKEAAELRDAVIAQSEDWNRQGRCVECGRTLSLLDKSLRAKKCGECRYVDETCAKFRLLEDSPLLWAGEWVDDAKTMRGSSVMEISSMIHEQLIPDRSD